MADQPAGSWFLTHTGAGNMELSGRVAIVTGGGRRLGQAICLALADAGASVLVHYSHSAEEARDTLEKITALGRDAVCVGADFQNPAAAAPKVRVPRTVSVPPYILNIPSDEEGLTPRLILPNCAQPESSSK